MTRRLSALVVLCLIVAATESLPVRAEEAAQRVVRLGFVVMGEPITLEHRKKVIALAAKHRLPAIYLDGSYVEAGGLMSYGPDFPAMWRRGAEYVDKILRGAKPADLPIEQPTRYVLSVNLKTAKAPVSLFRNRSCCERMKSFEE